MKEMQEKKKSSSSKKSKKRKHSDVEEHEEMPAHFKSIKTIKKEKGINTTNCRPDEVKENVDFPSCSDEHQNLGSQKEFNGGSWSKEDSSELIRRMSSQLPEHDTLSFSTRAERLDWSQIQFKFYSEEDCKEQWKLLKKNVRHFRFLKEVLEDCKAYVNCPWNSRSGKKKGRHPEQPARPLSSYMLFYMDKKDKLMKKYPNLKLTERARLIASRYKNLSEEHRAYYIERAKETQEEYKKNLEKFYEKYPEYRHTKPPSKTVTKKLCTPFKLFMQEKLQKHEHDEHFDRHTFEEKYKELWKTLSTKKKAYWIRRARDEEYKYLEHLQEDLSGDEDKPVLPHKSIITKQENAILDRLAGKPEKPPTSAYQLFSKLMLKNKEDYINGDPKSRMREMGVLWRKLPEDKKKAYAEKVQHMNELYKLEFANYLENLPEDKREEELAKVQTKKKSVNVKHKTTKESTSQKSKTRDVLKDEPEKPPQTAWDLYRIKYFKKNSHLPDEVAYKNAATLWKTLSPKEIEKYKKKYEKMKEKYMVDFTEFVKSLSEEELKEYYVKNQSAAVDVQSEEGTDDDEADSSSEDSKDDGVLDDSDPESNSSDSESDSGVSDAG